MCVIVLAFVGIKFKVITCFEVVIVLGLVLLDIGVLQYFVFGLLNSRYRYLSILLGRDWIANFSWRMYCFPADASIEILLKCQEIGNFGQNLILVLLVGESGNHLPSYHFERIVDSLTAALCVATIHGKQARFSLS